MQRHPFQPRREANIGGFIIGGLVGLLVAMFLISVVAMVMQQFSTPARGEDYPNCAGWISHSCCCTNDCCSEVAPGTVQEIGNDLSKFLIVATGQIVERTGWSKDGRFMRCACDYDVTVAKWVKHPKAHTRCIYPVRPTS